MQSFVLCVFAFTGFLQAQANVNARLDALEGQVAALSQTVSNCCDSRTSACSTRHGVQNVTKHGGIYPKDCTELFSMGYRWTGRYIIQPVASPRPFTVFCEMAYQGWTVILKRFDGSVDFYRDWANYKAGFGHIFAEHYLGNDYIYQLTNQPGRSFKMQVDFTYWSDQISYYAEYDNFRIGSESQKYQLHISGYSGNSGHDGLTGHNGASFSTKDRDNDNHGTNCAQTFKGAFWYTTCHSYSHPMGMYQQSCGGHDCIEWKKSSSTVSRALSAITMKVLAL